MALPFSESVTVGKSGQDISANNLSIKSAA